MNTPFTDNNELYGRMYVKKACPVVPSIKVRELERECQNYATEARLARLEIEHAHYALDTIGVPRLQASKFPLSLTGRLKYLEKKIKNKG